MPPNDDSTTDCLFGRENRFRIRNLEKQMETLNGNVDHVRDLLSAKDGIGERVKTIETKLDSQRAEAERTWIRATWIIGAVVAGVSVVVDLVFKAIQ